MSDTKVKVAVRVRPMNRRGKYISSRAHIYTSTFFPFLRHCCFEFWNDGSVARARFSQNNPSNTPPPLINNNNNNNNLISAEIELNTKCVVDMEDNQTVLHPPPSNAKGENSR